MITWKSTSSVETEKSRFFFKNPCVLLRQIVFLFCVYFEPTKNGMISDMDIIFKSSIVLVLLRYPEVLFSPIYKNAVKRCNTIYFIFNYTVLCLMYVYTFWITYTWILWLLLSLQAMVTAPPKQTVGKSSACGTLSSAFRFVSSCSKVWVNAWTHLWLFFSNTQKNASGWKTARSRRQT